MVIKAIFRAVVDFSIYRRTENSFKKLEQSNHRRGNNYEEKAEVTIRFLFSVCLLDIVRNQFRYQTV